MFPQLGPLLKFYTKNGILILLFLYTDETIYKKVE